MAGIDLDRLHFPCVVIERLPHFRAAARAAPLAAGRKAGCRENQDCRHLPGFHGAYPVTGPPGIATVRQLRDAQRAGFRAAQLVRAGGLERPHGRRRARRTPPPGGRAGDARHVEPRRVQQPGPSASEARCRGQGTGRPAAFRDERVGRRAAARAGRAPARAFRIRGWPRLLHPRRRRCQRERRADRPAGLEKAARPRRHARPLLSRRELHGHGAVRRLPHGPPGGRRSLGRAARAAAVFLPLPVRQRECARLRHPRGARRSRNASMRKARPVSPPC